MTDHLRRVALYVEEPSPGAFHWILLESPDDSTVWKEVKSSETPFASWRQAWDSGSFTLMKGVKDLTLGPRAAGEDENADPVG